MEITPRIKSGQSRLWNQEPSPVAFGGRSLAAGERPYVGMCM